MRFLEFSPVARRPSLAAVHCPARVPSPLSRALDLQHFSGPRLRPTIHPLRRASPASAPTSTTLNPHHPDRRQQQTPSVVAAQSATL
ncbi:hypothetical protein SMACR_03891 [Sordaria macrospora]|uniref:Uncharacterized protein n=1 Tax=Sordaria macrospora TaxID=5147 RepID=A0A8S8ZP49_SORMA|nr:hypothetical protein SMACR_03891 [Sordaria macrospora]